MPRYARMLGEGMEKRGHQVAYWTPQPIFFRLPGPEKLKKWLSYVDQYVLFPMLVKLKARKKKQDTLYVFTDHALGPWVPLVAEHPHVIHCHDFLAQFSAEDKIMENPVGWSGKKYQSMIRKGFDKGQHFISVSEKTRTDLHQFLTSVPVTSKMVHNGLNPIFKPYDALSGRIQLMQETGLDILDGYLLHVGGNQWYKNRIGVIDIYDSWRASVTHSLPLLMIGTKPDEALILRLEKSPYRHEIHCISGLSDKFVHFAYAGASLFLFPSYAEGFGWPVIEAMASGAIVLTTNDQVLRTVAADAAFYIPPKPSGQEAATAWAQKAAARVNAILSFPESVRMLAQERGFSNAKRFNAENKLNEIEEIYQHIVANHRS
ncbi:glycosyltransferase [Dyadobacter sp. CY326]|uniref:glycosyltransferase n=1 Tax=Dyadobacter sp. CY326 TaxID=2907300 RepID=UPI001F1D4F0F|nr:glycosyltransferase [Dyadobacter sp. CY326]MCE7066137.1 glycosyltransferase [Dyadobacter sp. CY326]